MMVALTRGGRNGSENLDSGNILKLGHQDFQVDWMWRKREKRAKDGCKVFSRSKLDWYQLRWRRLQGKQIQSVLRKN